VEAKEDGGGVDPLPSRRLEKTLNTDIFLGVAEAADPS
jgi:hypothetical protein